MTARLLIREDQGPVREFVLREPDVDIGRAPECGIRLTGDGVSRRHARIRRVAGAYRLEDLGSTNGIFLNRERVREATLRDGDLISVHRAQLKFVDDGGADAIVEVDHVSKEYQLGKQSVTALRDVTLAALRGEFLALAGPSGSGKSTLLNLIGCIDTPSSGSIRIQGQDVGGKTPDDLSDLRLNTLGFVFQTFNLLPVLTAWENVEYPLLQIRSIDKQERRARIGHYLKLVGLENHAHHRPGELSGGQRQRVAIARALATRPGIVLADEPTANLDHRTGEGILQLMKALNRDEGVTFIFSTHDARVMNMADRVIELADGQVVGQGG